MIKFIVIAIVIGMAAVISGCDSDQNKTDKTETQKEMRMKKVVLLTGEGFQDAEAYMPLGYLTNRGVEVTVAGVEKTEVKSYNSDFTIKIQKPVASLSVEDYDALVLPGGKAPAKLRENDAVVSFVKAFYDSGKPVAAICHAPQILIKAGIMEGKTATSYKSVKEEMIEAGVNYVDDAPVIDGNLITARIPKLGDRSLKINFTFLVFYY
jgi:protease I